MVDVLCLGEILVDWLSTEPGRELHDASCFTKAPGGAPANVAVGLARQGVSCGFIGRVANDAFGLWLKAVLEENGVDTGGTIVDTESQTRMAYVVTTADGDRKLAEFSRISVADSRLQADDLTAEMFERCKIFHFGSISLIEEPSAGATKRGIELAGNNHALISYDPNVRLGLWPSTEACRNTILDTLPLADVVKINVDELEFLTGFRDLETAIRLQKAHEIPLLLVTLDAGGAFLTSGSGSLIVEGFQVRLVEATGAGDAFVSGILARLLTLSDRSDKRREALESMSLSDLTEMVRYANAVGALACTKAGAIPALPYLAEVKSFLADMEEPSPASFPL